MKCKSSSFVERQTEDSNKAISHCVNSICMGWRKIVPMLNLPPQSTEGCSSFSVTYSGKTVKWDIWLLFTLVFRQEITRGSYQSWMADHVNNSYNDHTQDAFKHDLMFHKHFCVHNVYLLKGRGGGHSGLMSGISLPTVLTNCSVCNCPWLLAG